MAVQGLDTNGDGVFSKEELEAAGRGQCQIAQGFRLFHLRAYRRCATTLPLKPPEDYSLDYDKSLLTLHFTLPLETPLDPARQGGDGRRLRSVFLRRLRLRHRDAGQIVWHPGPRTALPRSRSLTAESEEDAKGAERSLFQSAWAEQQFRLAVCPDGGGQMRRRSILARAALLPCRDRPAVRLGIAGPDGCRARGDEAAQSLRRARCHGAECPGHAPVGLRTSDRGAVAGAGTDRRASSVGCVDTQQSMQRQLAAGVKSLKTDNAIAGRDDACRAQLHLWRGACRGSGSRQDDHLVLCRRQRGDGAARRDHLLHRRGAAGADGRGARRRPRLRAECHRAFRSMPGRTSSKP